MGVKVVAADARGCSRFRLLLSDKLSTLMAGRAKAGRPRSNRPQHGGKQMAMKLEDYANKYKTIKFERRDGILQMTLHSQGKELKWGAIPHEECCWAFADVARDPENRAVILTGTGEAFCDDARWPKDGGEPGKIPTSAWAHNLQEAKHLLWNHLNIEAPLIAAVNGPALI